LSASNATPTALTAFAALLMACGMAASYAADAPDNVQAEVDEAVQSCKDLEGTPNADAVLTVKDVNGDGGEDWIADYSKLGCKGGINQMCDVDGCTLQIYLWNGATAWNLAFNERVKSYKFSKRHGEHLLQVVKVGTACDRPSNQTCHMTYRLNKDSIDPVQ
jgi:hypothetical protein